MTDSGSIGERLLAIYLETEPFDIDHFKGSFTREDRDQLHLLLDIHRKAHQKWIKQKTINEIATRPPTEWLLDELVKYLKRFIVFGDEDQPRVLALWILHTHVFVGAYATPYMFISSPEMRSGKTLVMDVTSPLVKNGIQTVSITGATIFRLLATGIRTLFVDEVDVLFTKQGHDYIREILNAGYKQGAVVYRVNGQTGLLDEFPVFAPKMLAGIGDDCLPNTVRDRTINIQMHRKKPNEKVEPYQEQDEEEKILFLLTRIRKWYSYGMAMALKKHVPTRPAGLSDRAFEIWRPLLSLADLAGEGWHNKAQRAATNLSAGEEADESPGIAILRLLKKEFEETDRIFTNELAAKLSMDNLYNGPTTQNQVTRLVSRFRVKPQTIRVGERTSKGYYKHQFTTLFTRYVPDVSDVPDENEGQGWPPVEAQEALPMVSNGTSVTSDTKDVFENMYGQAL